MAIGKLPGIKSVKLKPAPLLFPNGGGLVASKQAKIKRAQAEEAAKQAKKAGK